MFAKSIIGVVVLGAIFAVGYGVLLENAYPFVFASKEARDSLNVTTSQLAELKNARFWNEGIAFAILFSFLAIVTGVACTFSSKKWDAKQLGRVLLLVVVSSPFAVLGFILAVWFDEQVDTVQDATMRSILRWLLLLLPGTIAIAFMTAVIEGMTAKSVDVIAGGCIGIVVGLGCYFLLHGSLTTYEARPTLLPDIRENRFLVGCLFILTPAIGTVAQINRFRKPNEPISK
jgi:hypothetical protein